jgi:hypothetical protein
MSEVIGSGPVLLTIVPVTGFQQQIQLACVDGVPAGYECSFSPTSLYAGNSYLRVRAPPVSKRPGRGRWFYYGRAGLKW